MRVNISGGHLAHIHRIRKHVGSPYLTHILLDVLICLVVIYGGMRWPAVVPPELWGVLVPAIVIHRYLVLSDPPEPMQVHHVDTARMHEERMAGILKQYTWALIINHTYIFPTLLTLYLVVLLIGQTGIFELQLAQRYLLIDQTLLLGLVIASGVLTVRGEEQRTRYQTTTVSREMSYLYIVLAASLSLLGTWIIMQQVIDLGVIGKIIAMLAGVLIWMVGMLLREEEGA